MRYRREIVYFKISFSTTLLCNVCWMKWYGSGSGIRLKDRWTASTNSETCTTTRVESFHSKDIAWKRFRKRHFTESKRDVEERFFIVLKNTGDNKNAEKDMEKTKTYEHTDNKRYKHNVTHTAAGESKLTVKIIQKLATLMITRIGREAVILRLERGCLFVKQRKTCR